MRFYVLGDPQVGLEGQTRRMHDKVRAIRADATSADACLIPGDLTHHGVGPVGNPFYRFLRICACCRGEGEVPDEDQLARFRAECLEPLREKCGQVLLCRGNHDTLTSYWMGSDAVTDFLRAYQGGDLVYERECGQGDNVLVYGLLEYPDAARLAWLRRRLEATRSSKLPVVIFFHFNITGPFSNWWKDEEKEAFKAVLDAHRERIAFLAVGHWHVSMVNQWDGHTVVAGSGDHAIVVDVEPDAKVTARLLS